MPRITRALSCAPLTAATAPTAAQYQWVPPRSRPTTPAPTIAAATEPAISAATGPTDGRAFGAASAVVRVTRATRAVSARPKSTLAPPTSSTAPKEAPVAGMVAHAPVAKTVNSGPGGCHCRT